MKNLLMLTIILLSFLTACGDDLSGLPDLTAKAPGFEPDSFTFETATKIKIGSRTFPSSVISNVPAGMTRYYIMSLEYFDACDSLGCLKNLTLVSSSDSVELGLSDAMNDPLQASPNILIFGSSLSAFFPDGDFDSKVDFYFTVKNSTAADIDYQVQLGFFNN